MRGYYVHGLDLPSHINQGNEMKTINTTASQMKQFTVATGERLASLGGGTVSAVVPSDSVDTVGFRRRLGFRTDCLEAGRFFWKGNVAFNKVDVDFSASTRVGAEGDLTGYSYEYLVFEPVFAEGTPDYLISVVIKHVMDDNYQAALLKESVACVE